MNSADNRTRAESPEITIFPAETGQVKIQPKAPAPEVKKKEIQSLESYLSSTMPCTD